MKPLLLCVLAMTSFVGLSQTPAAHPRLTGIVEVEDVKLAIIQLSSPPRSEIAFKEGQREGSRNDHLEVFAIDSTQHSVTADIVTNNRRTTVKLATAGAATNHTRAGIVLEEVRLQTVLDLFVQFADRTILQHPSLPDIKFSLAKAVTNRAEAAEVLKSALAEKGIAVVPDGPKFLMVARAEMASKLKPRAVDLVAANSEPLPPGSINFSSASLVNVLMIYAEFLGGKLDRNAPPLPDGKVVLRMPIALTKEECVYALGTLIGWHGVKLVPAGDGTFKCISTGTER